MRCSHYREKSARDRRQRRSHLFYALDKPSMIYQPHHYANPPHNCQAGYRVARPRLMAAWASCGTSPEARSTSRTSLTAGCASGLRVIFPVTLHQQTLPLLVEGFRLPSRSRRLFFLSRGSRVRLPFLAPDSILPHRRPFLSPFVSEA